MNKEICDHINPDEYKAELYVKINNKFVNYSVGKSRGGLCIECRTKAEIELREFLKSSKYFTELDPF